MSESAESSEEPHYDVVVVGAGFAGLGAALTLAESGARVLVCEALNYPGGCASTYKRGAYRFEAGATLFSGFGSGQLFRRWIDRYALDITIDTHDPLVEFRAEALTLAVTRERGGLRDQLAALPGAPRTGLTAFFAEQQRVADALWPLLDEPGLLPPLDGAALRGHLARLPTYLRLLPLLGRSLGQVLARHGLAEFRPLRAYLDALCQITVQCSAEEAEAPFALAALDYYYRGAGHVRGGIGRLAHGLVHAVQAAGGTVRMADAVRGLEPHDGGWRVVARQGPVCARAVIANVLPGALPALLGAGATLPPAARGPAAALEAGWGAAMLYLAVRPPAGQEAVPHHLQLVDDVVAPFSAGNHVFASISGPRDEGRAPEGLRTITVSTHVPLAELRRLPEAEQAARLDAIHTRMRDALRRRAPEWAAGIVEESTASPRTFERFTRRPFGAVGGVPRRRGLHHYVEAFRSTEMAPGLHLTGDTFFPGQSTLAAAVGGTRVAERVLRAL